MKGIAQECSLHVAIKNRVFHIQYKWVGVSVCVGAGAVVMVLHINREVCQSDTDQEAV